jgi:hypothetical protein
MNAAVRLRTKSTNFLSPLLCLFLDAQITTRTIIPKMTDLKGCARLLWGVHVDIVSGYQYQ